MFISIADKRLTLLIDFVFWKNKKVFPLFKQAFKSNTINFLWIVKLDEKVGKFILKINF